MFGTIGAQYPQSPEGLKLVYRTVDWDPTLVTAAAIHMFELGKSTTLSAAFVQPAQDASVAVSFGDSVGWLEVGDTLEIQDGGLYTVSAASGSTATIVNLGGSGNATPGATVPARSEVLRVHVLAPIVVTSDKDAKTVTLSHPWQHGDVPVSGVVVFQGILTTASGPILPDPIRHTFVDRMR